MRYKKKTRKKGQGQLIVTKKFKNWMEIEKIGENEVEGF